MSSSDASCAPSASNAAKGLVNHMSSGPMIGGGSASSSSAPMQNGLRLGRQSGNATGDAGFFAANSNAGAAFAPHPSMGPIVSVTPRVHHAHNVGLGQHNHSHHHQMDSPWAADFDAFDAAAVIPDHAFEAAFVGARGSSARVQSVAAWSQNIMQPRMMQQQQQHAFAPPAGMMQQHLMSAQQQHQQRHQLDPALEQEWSAQFSRVDSLYANAATDKGKGKGPVAQEQPHVHAADLESWQEEFSKLDLEGATDAEKEEMMAKMSEIWNELKNQELSESAGGTAADNVMQNPWDGGYEDFINNTDYSQENAVDPDPVTAPWTEYKFEPENPFLGRSDALAAGLKILESPGGSLSQAALAFEAAVQMDRAESSEAWMYLGKIQAENEKEDAAIIALQRSVKLDPRNLDALMSLSICYTNESQELQAYATLNRWLTTKYPSIPEAPVKEGTMNRFTYSYEIHESTVSRFLEAVQPGGPVDADIQLGLGVLFYNQSEYEKVIDCFSSALRVRSGDYLLWNRLGATLANSGRSEEAIEAYRKALELKPSFVRCRYNLGVSCINIGAYREAAEHLLGALSLHNVGDNSSAGFVNVSENLWDTLRRNFVQMGRMDLAEMTSNERDVNKFRKEFEF